MGSAVHFGLAFFIFLFIFVVAVMFIPSAAQAGVSVGTGNGNLVTLGLIGMGLLVFLGGGLL